MDIKTFQTLQAVVDHGSFARAGKAIGLSVSGVSLQIRAIEKHFNIVLFDRTVRPPKLTVEGHRFVLRSKYLLAAWANMLEEGQQDEVWGVLRLGAVPTVASGILPLALEKVKAWHPRLKIELVTGLAHELETSLRRSNLDAALLAHNNRMQPGLMWRPVCLEPLAVVAPTGARDDSDELLLRNFPFIRFRRVAWSLTRLIDQELSRRHIEVDTQMEIDTLEGILSLVSANLGVSIVPCRPIPYPFPEGVRWVFFGDPPATRSIGLLAQQETSKNEMIQELHGALVSVCQEHDYLSIRTNEAEAVHGRTDHRGFAGARGGSQDRRIGAQTRGFRGDDL